MTLSPSLAKTPKAKLERKVIRAIYTSNCLNAVAAAGLSTAVTALGVKTKYPVLLHIKFRKPKNFDKVEKEITPTLSLMTAPDFLREYHIAKRIEDQKAIDKAAQQMALARSLGLLSIVPKDLKPSFECRCGATFKRQPKLLSHQKSCSVLKDAEEVFAVVAAINERKKPKTVVKKAPKKSVKKETPHESKDTAKSSKKLKRKSVPHKTSSKKSKGKKDAKATASGQSRRKKH